MANLDNHLRISNHLAGELDIRSALKAVKGEIDKIITLDHLDVCLMDEDGVCNTSYEVGIRTSWSKERSLVRDSPVREILHGNTDAMLTPDATLDPRYTFPGSISGPIIKHKLRSRINVAMKVLGRTVGALNCSSREPDFYTETDVRGVQNLADILAPYFFALRAGETAKKEAIRRTKIASQQEGLRLGALHLTEALEQERQRIGMDLHDQTLADLTRLTREFKPGMSREETDKLLSQFQICIQQLRRIIESSVPSILELFGFEEAVRAHFESATIQTSQALFTYHDNSQDGLAELPEAVRIALFRICQEAINNSLKHANATQISVVVDQSEAGRMRMLVHDDGVFADELDNRQSGLLHMRTRSKLIGATFTIERTAGTTVSVELPTQSQKEIQVESSIS